MGEIFNTWQPSELNDSLHGKTMILNLGPSHPATHGTVRCIVELDGEKIIKSTKANLHKKYTSPKCPMF